MKIIEGRINKIFEGFLKVDFESRHFHVGCFITKIFTRLWGKTKDNNWVVSWCIWRTWLKRKQLLFNREINYHQLLVNSESCSFNIQPVKFIHTQSTYNECEVNFWLALGREKFAFLHAYYIHAISVIKQKIIRYWSLAVERKNRFNSMQVLRLTKLLIYYVF